jgi:hypothetical protein
MAQPWQADFYDCHKESHTDEQGVERFYMWWTAQRPDDVVPKGKTDLVRWVRKFDAFKTTPGPDDDENLERFNQMVTKWNTLGFVVRIGDDYVEDEAL